MSMKNINIDPTTVYLSAALCEILEEIQIQYETMKIKKMRYSLEVKNPPKMGVFHVALKE